MSIQENVQIVKDFFAAVGRGDKQGLLALSAEHIKWIEDSGFRDDVHAVFGLVAAEPAQGS
jgi:ketosteroid isomerase-like protein